MQIVVCAISGVLLIWGAIVCVVDYKEGAYAFDYFGMHAHPHNPAAAGPVVPLTAGLGLSSQSQ